LKYKPNNNKTVKIAAQQIDLWPIYKSFIHQELAVHTHTHKKHTKNKLK